jgi:hypothetical protein
LNMMWRQRRPNQRAKSLHNLNENWGRQLGIAVPGTFTPLLRLIADPGRKWADIQTQDKKPMLIIVYLIVHCNVTMQPQSITYTNLL